MTSEINTFTKNVKWECSSSTWVGEGEAGRGVGWVKEKKCMNCVRVNVSNEQRRSMCHLWMWLHIRCVSVVRMFIFLDFMS